MEKESRIRIKVKVRAIEKIQELYKTQVKKKEFMIKNNVHVSDKMLKVEDLMKNRPIIRSSQKDF